MLLLFESFSSIKVFATGAKADIWWAISILMFYPIVMTPLVALKLLFDLRGRIGLRSRIFPVSLFAACLTATPIVAWVLADQATAYRFRLSLRVR